VPDRTYSITWDSFNVTGVVEVDLFEHGGGKLADVAVVDVTSGAVHWRPADFGLTGDLATRYFIRITGSAGAGLVADSREPFAIPDVDPPAATTFFVNDDDTGNDAFTNAVGDNRNTGTTPDDPKAAIRPVLMSYHLDTGDRIHVDTGSYIHAINVNLSSTPLVGEPGLHTAQNATITGPSPAHIDRANLDPRAFGIQLVNSPNVTLAELTIVGAGTGVRVADGSSGFTGMNLQLSGHRFDGMSLEGQSHDATLTGLTIFHNARHGVFVDESRLIELTGSEIRDNGGIGVALRSSGGPIVADNEIFNNFRGVDVLNPGAMRATIGDASADLAAGAGNLIFNNEDDGVFASGNVEVIGNTIANNGSFGIRLDDGADALRNVVRQHVTGISALGSTSDVIENRSFANSNTGIEASFQSNVQRNVTYSNDVNGIHVDRFEGAIDHNLVYSTGHHPINLEGPGIGAQLVNNTVYESCASNDHPGETVLNVSWDWAVTIEEFGIGQFPVQLRGNLQLRFGQPVGNLGGTFQLGGGDAAGAESAESVPEGETFTIPIEILSLGLRSVMPTEVGGMLDVTLGPSHPAQPAIGTITVENQGGFLSGNVTLISDFLFSLPDRGLTLLQVEPAFQSLSFGPSSGFGPLDVLQTPLLGLNTFEMPLFDPEISSSPWGLWRLEQIKPPTCWFVTM